MEQSGIGRIAPGNERETTMAYIKTDRGWKLIQSEQLEATPVQFLPPWDPKFNPDIPQPLVSEKDKRYTGNFPSPQLYNYVGAIEAYLQGHLSEQAMWRNARS
jgi:hypothetical protein